MILSATASIFQGDNIAVGVRESETVERHIAVGIGRDLTLFINDKQQAEKLASLLQEAVKNWEAEA